MDLQKPSNLSIRCKDAFERRRLDTLAGAENVTDFVLGLVFRVKRARGSDVEYPGWEVVERNRRDLGIKIEHPKHGSVILYPEDEAYEDFAKL